MERVFVVHLLVVRRTVRNPATTLLCFGIPCTICHPCIYEPIISHKFISLNNFFNVYDDLIEECTW